VSESCRLFSEYWLLFCTDAAKRGVFNEDMCSVTDNLLGFVDAGKISNNVAKEVFSEMIKTGKRAKEIIEEKSLEQVSDSGKLERIVEKIIVDNPAEIKRYKAGDSKLFGFLMGQAMKESKGKANPKVVKELLDNKLK